MRKLPWGGIGGRGPLSPTHRLGNHPRDVRRGRLMEGVESDGIDEPWFDHRRAKRGC
jgi:hypothetical protein